MLQILFVYIPVILFILLLYVSVYMFAGHGVGWVIGSITEALSENEYLFYKDDYMSKGGLIGLVIGIISIFVIYIYLKNKKNIDIIEVLILGGIASAEDPKETKKQEETRALKTSINNMNKRANSFVNRDLELEMRKYVFDYLNIDNLRDELIKVYNESGIDTRYIFLRDDDIRAVYGNVDSDKMTKIIRTQLNDAIMIKMAQRGYLPFYIAHGGYGAPNYGLEDEWYINMPNLMMYVTNQLKEHGFKDDVWALGRDSVYYKVGSQDFFLHPRKFYTGYKWTYQLEFEKKRGG